MYLALQSVFRESGLRGRRLIAALRAWPSYVRDRKRFHRLAEEDGEFAWGRELPILTEKEEASGGFGAYLLQDLTVSRWILQADPLRHVDVGSRIDGFVAHLAVFREVEVIDIRSAPGAIPGVLFHQLDLMSDLPVEWRETCESLSCLHTIEHFGLGRYGDPVDPKGYLKGLERLKAMVKPGGLLYLSTPIGPQRIEFNAHRIFSPATLLGWFEEGWDVERFAVLNDDNRLLSPSPGDKAGLSNHFGCNAGVGIVAVRKRV